MSGRGRWCVALLVGAVLSGAFRDARARRPGNGESARTAPSTTEAPAPRVGHLRAFSSSVRRHWPSWRKLSLGLGASYVAASLLAGGPLVPVVDRAWIYPEADAEVSIRSRVPQNVMDRLGVTAFASNQHGGDQRRATAFRIETLLGGSGHASLVAASAADQRTRRATTGAAPHSTTRRAISHLKTGSGVEIITDDRITETPDPWGGLPEVSEVMSLGASLGPVPVKALHAWVLGETRVIPNVSGGGGWTVGAAVLDLGPLAAAVPESLAEWIGRARARQWAAFDSPPLN